MKVVKILNKNKLHIYDATSYKSFEPENKLIYCDPPYEGNIVSNEFFENFNHNEFWNIMRKWSEKNLVFISERIAPADFKPIWSKEHNATFFNQNMNINNKKKYSECLYIHESHYANLNN